MHIVHGEIRKAPYLKDFDGGTMFALELSEMIKDYKTGEKTYTNYRAALFAKTDAHINHYRNTLVEGNFIVLTSEKLKVVVSECGQYIKLDMDNARLEGSGYIQQQAPQQKQQQQRQAPQQQAQGNPNGQQRPQQNQGQQQAAGDSWDDGDIPF